MNTPKIIFIHGPAASGKYTIAKELSKLSGLPLFHNHLTVDLLLSLFPFGSPEFIRHRESIWQDLMTDAIARGDSVIFTFNPERTVSRDFPKTLQSLVSKAGGQVHFVEVICREEELENRMEAASRRDFMKLSSRELYRQLKQSGAFDYPPIPSECKIDSTHSSPEESAVKIIALLELPMEKTT